MDTGFLVCVVVSLGFEYAAPADTLLAESLQSHELAQHHQICSQTSTEARSVGGGGRGGGGNHGGLTRQDNGGNANTIHDLSTPSSGQHRSPVFRP